MRFFRSRPLNIAIALVIGQQVSLGLSTFYLACAGNSLGTGSVSGSLNFLSLFLVFASAGYVQSTISALFCQRAQNNWIRNYYEEGFKIISSRSGLSDPSNRSRISAWMTSEAPDTLDDFGFLMVDGASVLSNILITLVVLFVTVGPVVSGATFLAMGLAVAIILFLKKYVTDLGQESQVRRLEVNSRVPQVVAAASDGSERILAISQNMLSRHMREYFFIRSKYTKVEQLASGLPILLAVPILFVTINLLPSLGAAEIGMLVAVLPRILQTLGNIHALISVASRYFYLRAKLHGLGSFFEDLTDADWLSRVKLDEILVVNPEGVPIDAARLVDEVLSRSRGRICVSGRNGSGKSSLLRYVRSAVRNATYLGPESFFMDEVNGSKSTGQGKLDQIEHVFENGGEVILLDEWDANLDADHMAILDALIWRISSSRIVVEVRHERRAV